MRGPNCTKLAKDTEGSLLSHEVVSDFRYLASLQTRAARIRAMLKTMPNLALFDPPPVKIRGGVGEISELRFKALPRT